MKTVKFLFAMWACSSAALAQDYYAPTDKDKEPVARFPLEKIEIKTNTNGVKTISYQLPATLTGEVNTITATEVKLPGLEDHNVQIFAGEQATVTCMGTDEKPGCMVTHRNLLVNRTKAEAAIDDTFFDPQARADARMVSREFREPLEHSGNQPIGVLGGLKPRPAQVLRPSGKMPVQYVKNGQNIQVMIDWTLTDENPNPSYQLSNQTYELTDIRYFGNRARGHWKVKNAVSHAGWFEFNFNSRMNRFEGYYGLGKNGSPRAGRWTSVALCNTPNCQE